MTEQLSFGDPYGWISREERLPGPEDGDAQGCVLAWHEYNGASVAGNWNYANPGWRAVRENAYFTHWMRLPPRPAELEEKRLARIKAARGAVAWTPGK